MQWFAANTKMAAVMAADAVGEEAIGAAWRWLAESSTAAWAIDGVAFGALALVLAVVLSDWWVRRRVWLSEPHRLTEPRPARNAIHAVTVAACVLVGVAGIARPDAWTTTIALLIAAIACMTTGHIRRWSAASAVGLALLAGGVASLFVNCGWTGRLGSMFAVAVASGYMLWLARFWQQQLRDGLAWTTTGRMISAARWLSAGGALLLAWLAFAPTADAVNGFTMGPTGIALVVLVVLVLSFLQLRDAHEHAPWLSGSAACVTIVSWAVPAGEAIMLFGWEVPLAMPIALGGLVLAVRKFFMGHRLCAPAVRAYIGVVVPGIVLFALVNEGISAPMLVAGVMSVFAVVLVVVGSRGGSRAG